MVKKRDASGRSKQRPKATAGKRLIRGDKAVCKWRCSDDMSNRARSWEQRGRETPRCVCVCVCVCVDRDTEDECEEVDEDVPTTKQSRAGQREDNAAESTADSRSVVPGTFAASVAVEAGGSAVGGGATACRGGRRDSELEGVGKEDCE